MGAIPFFCAGFRAHLHRGPRSSLSETALATEIYSTSSSSSSSSSTVGLSDKEREWSARSHSGYCSYSPSQRNVTGPFFGHSCCPDQPPLLPGVLEQVIWCVFYPTWSCQLRALRTSVTHLSPPLPHTQSHSATTLAYESTTHASTTGSTHAANGEADRLVSFPLAHFGRHNIALLSLYFDTFQWRVESTSHRRLRYTLTRRCVCRWCRC